MLTHSQASDVEVYDVHPFLSSKLFLTNGYRYDDGAIKKVFRTHRDDE